MRQPIIIAAALAATPLLASCGNGEGTSATPAADATAAGDAAGVATAPAAEPETAPADLAQAPPCTDYRADLTDADLVMIYWHASGLTPPRERWAENALSSVSYQTRTADPEGSWKEATQKVDAQFGALKDVRCLQLRFQGAIGGYDPATASFPVEDFRPGNYFNYSVHGQNVRLVIRNGKDAGWPVPPERARALAAATPGWPSASFDTRLRVVGARPSPGGDVLETVVESYDVLPAYDRRGAAFATVSVSK